jgi:uncharacterized membrane protein
VNVLAAFVGAFAALVALAEVQASNKIVRYFAALLVGAVGAFLLSLILNWAAGVLSHAHV